jgi:hypothetical protein
MAADPFNSAGGYTIGIPPIIFVDSGGNLQASTANINAVVANSITSNAFYGTFYGNITGNVTIDAANTQVLFTVNTGPGSDGVPTGSDNFTFDSVTNQLTLKGDLFVDSVTLGTGNNEFSTSRVTFATTVSDSIDQVLHITPSNEICSIDYTIIATDTGTNARQTSKLFATVYGNEVGYFEYGTIDVPLYGPGVGDFKVVYDSGNVLLTVTPVTSNLVNYKIMVTSYKE